MNFLRTHAFLSTALQFSLQAEATKNKNPAKTRNDKVSSKRWIYYRQKLNEKPIRQACNRHTYTHSHVCVQHKNTHALTSSQVRQFGSKDNININCYIQTSIHKLPHTYKHTYIPRDILPAIYSCIKFSNCIKMHTNFQFLVTEE